MCTPSLRHAMVDDDSSSSRRTLCSIRRLCGFQRMIKRHRMIVVGGCVACVCVPTILFVWSAAATRSTPASAQAAGWVSEFGLVRWLTLQSATPHTTSPSAGVWSVAPIGVVLNAALTIGVMAVGWCVGRWLVRNSAIEKKCDCCGYASAGQAEYQRCTECGSSQHATGRALMITQGSWSMLLTGLVMFGAAGVGLAVSQMLRVASTVSLVLHPAGPPWSPAWWPDNLSSSLIGLSALAACTIAVWLYREPSKHPPDRAANFFKRRVH